GPGPPGGVPGGGLARGAGIPGLQPFPEAGFDMGAGADRRLGLVAGMQVLPPRQRAVLLLRGVLEFSAAEVAAQLETTVPAVNSALQRARAALAAAGDVGAVTEPDDAEARSVIDRDVRAFEAGHGPALRRLLSDDVVLGMPPVRLWCPGSRGYG